MDPSDYIAVVGPDGRISLINANTKVVQWLFTTKDNKIKNNNNKIYQSVQGMGVNDYMDVTVDDRGEIRLVHYYEDKPPEFIPWISHDHVHTYVKSQFGEEAFFKYESMVVDLNNQGKRVQRREGLALTNYFRIEKIKYRIFTDVWDLKFSKCKAQFNYNDEVFCSIPLYHTHDAEAFSRLFRLMKVDDACIANSIWDYNMMLHPVTRTDTLIDKNYDAVFLGSMGSSFTVVVKKLPRSDGIPLHIRNLWKSDCPSGIRRFYGINIDNDNYYIIYEHLRYTLYDYLRMGKGRNKEERENVRKLLMGLLVGLTYLRHKRLCHTKLNPWNLLLTHDFIVKISGAGNLKPWTADLEEQEMQDLARLIIICYSNPDRYNLADRPSLEKNYEPEMIRPDGMFEWAAEAIDVVTWMQSPSGRKPSLEEVAYHPMLWETEKRIQFLKDSSEFLDTSRVKKHNVGSVWTKHVQKIEEVVSSMYTDRYTCFKARSWTNSAWKDMMPSSLVVCMESLEDQDPQMNVQDETQKKKNYHPYTRDHPRELLRFMRNLLSHFPSVLVSNKLDDHALQWLGDDTFSVENSFREMFPDFLIDLFNYLLFKVPKVHRKSLQAYYRKFNS